MASYDIPKDYPPISPNVQAVLSNYDHAIHDSAFDDRDRINADLIIRLICEKLDISDIDLDVGDYTLILQYILGNNTYK
jgi:hypothetical protein